MPALFPPYDPENPRVYVAPSLLAADFANLSLELERIETADALHFDVMDGVFVPNLSFGPPVLASLRAATSLPFDCHLMMEDPGKAIDAFARAGATSITVHQETCPHLNRTLQQIRDAGLGTGVCLNPSTPLLMLEEVLDMTDMVLLMSVNPGFGGQSFIPQTLDKIKRLRKMADRLNPGLHIEVDGGVSPDNAQAVVAAGADVLVAGSAVFGSEDAAATIAALRG